MADKQILIELDIDVNAAAASTLQLKQKLADLQDEAKKVKASHGEMSAEFIAATAATKATAAELRTMEGITKNVVASNNAATGSINEMRAKLAVITAQWNGLSEEERKNSAEGKKLAAQKTELSKVIREETMATGDGRANVGRYTESIQDAMGSIGGLNPVLGTVTQGVTGLGGAFKLMLGPVGLIIAAVGAMIAYFKSSEEGSDRLAKITAILSIVFENLMDVVEVIGGALVDAITKPKEAWEGFKTFMDNFVQFFKDTFGNVIGGYIDIWVGGLQSAFANVGLAWQKFKGVFVDNNDEIKASQAKVDEANQKVADGVDRIKEGVTNMADAAVAAYDAVVGAVSDMIAETAKEIEATKRLEDAKANLRRKERAELVSNAKIENEIAELRAKVAKKDIYDGTARIEMLDKVEALMNKQMTIEINNAKLKASVHRQEMAMGDETTDMLDEQAKLDSEIIKIQTANADKRRSLEKQRISALNEIEADELAMLDTIAKAEEDYAKQSVATAQAAFEKWKNTEGQKITTDAEYTKQLYEQRTALLEEQFLNDQITAADRDAQLQALKLERDQQYADIKREADMVNAENDYAIAEQNAGWLFDLERQKLEEKRLQEVAYAEKIGADVNKINDKFAKANIKISRLETQAKLSLASDFMGNIATLAGEGTAIGKAAAAAQTAVSTYQAAMGAYSSLAGIPVVGPALGIAAAAAATLTGLNSIKGIYATKSGLPGDSSSGGATVSDAASSAAAAPIRASGIDPNVNEGIISRDSYLAGTGSPIQLQPTLVTDNVTQAQKQNASNLKTSTI